MLAAPSRPARGFRITFTGMREMSASIGDLSRNDCMKHGPAQCRQDARRDAAAEIHAAGGKTVNARLPAEAPYADTKHSSVRMHDGQPPRAPLARSPRADRPRVASVSAFRIDADAEFCECSSGRVPTRRARYRRVRNPWSARPRAPVRRRCAARSRHVRLPMRAERAARRCSAAARCPARAGGDQRDVAARVGSPFMHHLDLVGV